jgi:hypothetical protein
LLHGCVFLGGIDVDAVVVKLAPVVMVPVEDVTPVEGLFVPVRVILEEYVW